MNTLAEIRKAFGNGLDPRFKNVLVTLENNLNGYNESEQHIRFEANLLDENGQLFLTEEQKPVSVVSRIGLNEQISNWDQVVAGAHNAFARVLDPTIPALYPSIILDSEES
jgi:hypothetical protein